MYFIYLLQSESTGRSYIGITTDPQRRIRQHRREIRGGARSTRICSDWKMIFCMCHPDFDRGCAMGHEKRLKRHRGCAQRLAAMRRLAASLGALCVE